MRIFVTIKPNAPKTSIEQIDHYHYRIAVREPPIRGKANAAVIHACADYFHVPQSSIHIVSGYTSRNKILDIA